MKKSSYLSGVFMFIAIEAFAKSPIIRIKCVNGAEPVYGETVATDVTVDFDEWNGGEMGGSYSGHMVVLTTDKDNPAVVVDVKEGSGDYNKDAFWGHYDDDYWLATSSDIFKMGVKRISTLTLTNAKKWRKTFPLICERVI